VESVHLVAIRNCGRRQEAQDVSLAITGKYDNIPFCGARLWYDDDTTTIDFGSVAVTPGDPKLSQWKSEISVHAPDLPTRQNSTIRINTNKYI
jgi:hypothetical protein